MSPLHFAISRRHCASSVTGHTTSVARECGGKAAPVVRTARPASAAAREYLFASTRAHISTVLPRTISSQRKPPETTGSGSDLSSPAIGL